MPEQIRPQSTNGSEAAWRRRLFGALLALLAVAALVLAGPPFAFRVALQMASHRIAAHQFGPAQEWLAWSGWLRPEDYRSDLLRATCLRNLKETDQWSAALREAQRKGAPKYLVDQETKLGRLTPRRSETPGSGPELYATHCTACHGAAGNGRGDAARYLFPRPRDFGAGGLQMASTSNGVASLEDVEKVLAQGMSGTSMQAFDTLSPSQHKLLAQEVLRLRREGAQQQIARAMREAGEEPLEAEVRDAAERTTTPGRPVPLPEHWSSGDQAVARGKAAYQTLGCNKCHGDDGAGALDPPLFDVQGEPNRARDLVHEPFKGGRERESVGLRIAVGMPGTAHPAVSGLSQQQMADLVEYVLSLARQPSRVFTNYDRRVQADARVYREGLGR